MKISNLLGRAKDVLLEGAGCIIATDCLVEADSLVAVQAGHY